MDENEHRHFRWIEAARRGDVAAVAAFIDQGMDVDAGSASGITALMQAVGWGQFDVVRLLLDRGADPNLTDAQGYSATTCAIAAPRNGHEMLPILLAAGGRRQTLPDAVWSGDVELARTLLDEGADVDFGKGWTYHGTMLQVASLLGDLAMVDLFLARGADTEEESDIHERPLTVASERGHVEVVRRLLDYGADVDVVDQYGMSALSHASEKGNRPLYKLLLARGAKIRMFDALNEGDLIMFESLLDAQLREDADVDHISRWGGGRLAAYAAEVGNVVVLQMALDRGAVLHHDAYDGTPPLALAAKGGNIEAMELLIARGADPNRSGGDGLTPLAWALKEGQAEAAALLRHAGAVL
ncbi:ankyrin repeat domain-containing protein [Planctomyces sp. SH-PL62]|uniref:ankyrin repeat domain-containing protein n=1 Tax=Planctomyces sp. SH-PL62 TaxID=1636152 RepID=UPI00078DCE38|nr:ankyrin repeat domain-containing protein [Planctomyces sp. SH-PL62]AMV37802.1 Phosphocholine transferase AnkX [Planctomyces sp. SH-PL62]